MTPLVVRVEDTEGGRPSTLAFLKSPVRIGRGELNDLHLDRPFVSTYHGLVQFDEDGASYVDLGSTNGSALDGGRLEKNAVVALPPGSVIAIGTLRLRFDRRATGERFATAPRQTVFARRAAEAPPRVEPPRPVATPAPPAEAVAAPMPPVLAAPPPGPAELAARAAAAARADAAIEAAALDLDLSYTSYRGAFEYLRAAVDGAVAALDEAARPLALERLAERYPALRGEPEFASRLPQAPGRRPEGPLDASAAALAPPPAPAVAPRSATVSGGEAARLLEAFAGAYLPGGAGAAGSAAQERLLGRVAGVLETYSRSFLELRRGYEEFGREMGVRTAKGEGFLARAVDVPQIMAYLLDPGATGRDEELQRAFADFMLHQVALLRGVVDGAQALLADLSPEALERDVPQRAWMPRGVDLWKAFQDRYHELADEDAAVSERLFGKEFARAYAAISGEAAPRAKGTT